MYAMRCIWDIKTQDTKMQLYLKSETYVHHHGTYYLVPLMVSVYMYTYLLIKKNLKSDFFFQQRYARDSALWHVRRLTLE